MITSYFGTIYTPFVLAAYKTFQQYQIAKKEQKEITKANEIIKDTKLQPTSPSTEDVETQYEKFQKAIEVQDKTTITNLLPQVRKHYQSNQTKLYLFLGLTAVALLAAISLPVFAPALAVSTTWFVGTIFTPFSWSAWFTVRHYFKTRVENAQINQAEQLMGPLPDHLSTTPEIQASLASATQEIPGPVETIAQTNQAAPTSTSENVERQIKSQAKLPTSQDKNIDTATKRPAPTTTTT